MNNDLTSLKPVNLWKNFQALCAIPHPSGKEAAISQFVIDFAKKLNLETHVDEVGNVIIRKAATPGMENRKGVILQGHLDMVPQKNSDKNHDFEKDPIKAVIDGEWVRASGTTLGADNGVGVAASMAILESTDIPHGPIEALFTIDEETGMTGAFGLKSGLLKGDILMNLDSEDEGELYIGCAGGTNSNITYQYHEIDVPSGMASLKIEIKGLKGGHSGVDIHLGRGNSNKILNRYLFHARKEHGIKLAWIDGGSLRNAIPRESFAHIVLPVVNKEKFLKCIKDYESIVGKELSAVEPDFKIDIVEVEMPKKLIDDKTVDNFIKAIYGCPNGVVRMSNEMAGLVETSNNLAIMKSGEGKIFVKCLLRSSVDSAKIDLEQAVESVFTLAGAEVIFDGQYPGWKPNPSSPILKQMLDIYNKKYGKIPEIRAIHAGLECGILGAAYPHWDMISFGPTIRYPHSPDEKVNIATVEKFYDFLVDVLKNIEKK